jgi:hypothetical protein
MCLSSSLPTLFGRAGDYQRQITLTAKGLVVVETASDPDLTDAIRAHAREVIGFVVQGMPAMMQGMITTSSTAAILLLPKDWPLSPRSSPRGDSGAAFPEAP